MTVYTTSLVEKGLIDAELIQVCIGFNEIILRFYPEERSLTVMSVDSFLTINSKWMKDLTSGDKDHSPFGKKVIKFNQFDENIWCIYLSNGDRICIENDEKGCESFIFKIRDNAYVI